MVVVALLIVTAVMYVTERSSMYFPWPDPADAPPPGIEALEIATDDGLRLGAWFVPAATDRAEPGPAVLVCNGNAGHRAHRLPLAQALAERGYDVLLFDYRGYAANPGSPTEEGLRTDARGRHARPRRSARGRPGAGGVLRRVARVIGLRRACLRAAAGGARPPIAVPVDRRHRAAPLPVPAGGQAAWEGTLGPYS